MSEVNNRTLAALLVVAIVVSLGGTFISLNKLGSSNGGVLTLTAFGTVENGTINVSVTRELSITLTDASIDLGTGQPNAGVASFSCDSATGTATNWTVSSGCTADYMQVNNSGTVVANVSMKNDKNNTEFICDQDATGTCDTEGVGQVYQFKVPTNTGCIDEPTTYTDFTGSAATATDMCNRLGSTYTFNMEAYFRAPADFDTSGVVQDTVRFTAIDALSPECGTGC